MRKRFALFLLFFLFFLSPALFSGATSSSLFEEKRYDELLRLLKKAKLTRERMYLETLSYHALGDDEAAWEIGSLYIASTTEEDGKREEMEALLLPLAFARGEWNQVLCWAKRDNLSPGEAMLASQAAMKVGSSSLRDELFSRFIKGKVSEAEYASLLLTAHFPVRDILEATKRLSPDERVSLFLSGREVDEEESAVLLDAFLPLEESVTDRSSYLALMARLSLGAGERVLYRRYRTLLEKEATL